MFYRKQRADKIVSELKSLCMTKIVPIEYFAFKQGFFMNCKDVDQLDNWEEFDTSTMRFIGNDMHYWFKTEFEVTQDWEGKTIVWEMDLTKEEWNQTGSQFLFFVNGVPYQGVDGNHTFVKLTDEATIGEKYRLDIQAYTGKDHFRQQGVDIKLKSSLKALDLRIEQLYYDLQVPLWIIENIDAADKVRLDIETVLEHTINLIDLREPYSESFYDTVEQAIGYIEKTLYEEMAGESDIIATCIGHTHIDVAWWWTVEQTKEKVARSFSTVLRLMEEYPEYVFMSSQPQLYKFLKQRYPELYTKIKERVEEGRWEPEGAMWLEADCNLVSGESFVRQLLHGKKFFKEEFGRDSKILWLPDVFGYSAALPQILKKSGIDYFMTTKISWNQYNMLPCDTFNWQGIDGSEVFTHFITTTQKKKAEGWQTTYNGMLYPKSLMYGWERYQQKDINDDILVCYGYGDGGGGPNREMIEVGKRLEKGVKGAPRVKFGTATDYFDKLYNKVKDNKRLPKWIGELYFEYHRGTYTSMARNKRSNRKSELLWQDVEFFASWCKLLTGQYPTETIFNAWEKILLNQFHDILPGSSIKEVYETTKEDYKQLEEKGNALIQESLETLAEHIKADQEDLILFNTLSFTRNDIVKYNATDNTTDSWEDEEGKVYIAQRTHDGQLAMYVENIPAKGYKVLRPSSKYEDLNGFVFEDNGVTTPYYHITWDEKGLFTSIFDRSLGREMLKVGHKGNVMKAFEDKPMNWDAWDIDIYYSQKSWVIDELESLEWVEKGPIRATLKITRLFLSSEVVQYIHFYTYSKRIDFETEINWKQKQLLVKVEFPLDIHTTTATYDIQFGNVERPTHRNTSWDLARFEVCAHKWADLSERSFGVSLLNDCKYGHDILEGTMRLTLIKSGIMPNPEADKEMHYFTYSLLSHEGDFLTGHTHQEGYKLNVPVYSTWGKGMKREIGTSLVTVDKENIILETVKEAQNKQGMIIRLYEYAKGTTTAHIKWQKEDVKVYECDLMENILREVPVANGVFEVTFTPFEIKTYYIQ